MVRDLISVKHFNILVEPFKEIIAELDKETTPILIEKIIAILKTDGEIMTDGECLNEIAELLGSFGYDVFPTLGETK